jgi:hypothetical protein
VYIVAPILGATAGAGLYQGVFREGHSSEILDDEE